MNQTLQMIFARRSVRRYEDREVPQELVADLLQAAMAAPSARAADPWHFIEVREQSQLDRLAEGLPNGRMLPSASVGIVVCGSLREAHDHKESYLLQDCSAAVENMLIAAAALGLGACWLGVHPREERIAHLRAVLGLPEHIVPVAVVAVGYPAELPEPRTRYNPAKVRSERW
jgi:nitroreductase